MKKKLIVIASLLCVLLTVFPSISTTEGSTIHIKEMDRISYNIFQYEGDDLKVKGYHILEGRYSRLPIGSTLDTETGIFHWLPGPGFLGEYDFVFYSSTHGEEKKIKICISPKFGEIHAAKVRINISRILSTEKPFGSFDTPINGTTVASSVAVTGWALDNSEIENVKIYRGETNNLIYIGDAVLVEGARPDVAALYPDYPNNTKAGWGYMLLTNFLPNGGNGTFKIHAIASDNEGNSIILDTKTIHVDNANAVKPFGAIDTPTQGGSASGSSFINWGWVLTPQPNIIPTDGSTIRVWVDGLNVGQPTYNIYRNDIADFFPDYANSSGAVGYFSLDTTLYENGVHTIQWTAKDSAGNSDGIGSRYFTVNDGLPPDPGEEGKQTIKGIDSDNDGIRDDIQRYIAIEYTDADTRNALKDITIHLQNFISDKDNKDKTISYAKELNNSMASIFCARSSNGDVSEVLEDYYGQFLNTADRILAYNSAQSHLGGETFELVDSQGCNKSVSANNLSDGTQNDDVISIFFANGMFTKLHKAIEARDILESLFMPKINPDETVIFYLSYNDNESIIPQLVEVARQRLFSNWSSFYMYLIKPHLAPQWFSDTMITLSSAVNKLEYVIDTDLRKHVSRYEEELKRGKIVVVAHSQGNFYANSAYKLVDSDNFRIVSVANPDDHVGGCKPYPYVTLNRDKVINEVRKIFPLTLSGNMDNSSYHIFGLNHSFINDYLEGDNTGPEILRLMRNAIDNMEFTMEWIDVPAGNFEMGDNFNEGETDERPVHTVYLDSYKISKYEVTFEQYDKFCKATCRSKPSDSGWGRGSRPVINVSWNDAKAFCQWLSKKMNKNIHLPTEAQWEKAARRRTQMRYPWGNSNPNCSIVNYNNCKGKTAPVGSYSSGISPYMVNDMGGNVYEWCKDWYNSTYYSNSPSRNPHGPSNGSIRVTRGGAWNSLDFGVRASDRSGSTPSFRNNFIGFRVVQE